jgi:hypothetical protein
MIEFLATLGAEHLITIDDVSTVIAMERSRFRIGTLVLIFLFHVTTYLIDYSFVMLKPEAKINLSVCRAVFLS